MAKQDTPESPARRKFFRAAASGAVGAAALGVTAGTAAAGTPARDDKRAGEYRETDHVKAAYRTARF